MSGDLVNERLKRREEIMKNIEFLRCKLACLIITKGTLEDPEVLVASQQLDSALNEFYLGDLSLKADVMG